MRVAPAVMVVAMVAFGAGRPMAQTDDPRVLLSLNLGLQPGIGELTDAGAFTLYDEAGALAVSGDASTGALLDMGVAARVAGRVTPGCPGSARPAPTTPQSAARRPTRSSSTSRGRSRRRRPRSSASESAFHFSVGYLLQATDRLDVHIYGGPTHVPASPSRWCRR